MNEDYIHNKIGPLAKFIAYLRTFSNIPYSKEIAQLANARKSFTDLFGNNETLLAWAALVVEARYKAISYALALFGIRNVLEIAAGLSPRGLAFTDDTQANYVETDLPDIIAQKELIVRKIIQNKKERGLKNLHFTPANAIHRNEIMRTMTFFDRTKKIAVIHDGLMPYLTKSEQKIFAANIHSILSIHGGIWVHTDVALKSRYRKVIDETREIKEALYTISTIINRDIEDNAFDDENGAMNFFNENNFFGTKWEIAKCVGTLSSAEALCVTAERAQGLLEGAYVWVLEAK